MSDVMAWSTSDGSNVSTPPDGYPERMASGPWPASLREVMAAFARNHIRRCMTNLSTLDTGTGADLTDCCVTNVSGYGFRAFFSGYSGNVIRATEVGTSNISCGGGGVMYGICGSGGFVYGVGAGGNGVLSSDNGDTFAVYAAPIIASPANHLYCVERETATGRVYAGGENTAGSGNAILVRVETSSLVSNSLPNTVIFRGIATDHAGTWVAVGSNGSAPYIARSTNNGTAWSAVTFTPTGFTFRDVKYGGSRWVAVGTSGAAYYSTDSGATWTAYTTGTTETLYRAAYDSTSGVWVLAGGGTSATVLLYTVDNSTFTAMPGLTDYSAAKAFYSAACMPGYRFVLGTKGGAAAFTGAPLGVS